MSLKTPFCHDCHRSVDRKVDDVVGFDVESDRYDTPQLVAHRACRIQWLRAEGKRLEDEAAYRSPTPR